MPIKVAQTKITELKGVNYVQQIVNDSHCIFNKVDGTNDIGIDGYIEFTKDDSPSGLCVAVQIKSGNSNLPSDRPYVNLKADKDHFKFWFKHVLPIFAIVYIPKEDAAYWFDVTQYLHDNEACIENGPYTIKVSKDQVFDLNNFENFNRSAFKYQTEYGNDRYFGRALKELTDFVSPEQRYSSIRALFSFHRNKPETWYYLITRFCFEPDFEVQQTLIYCFRHLLTHGDIWWHAGNIIDSEGTIAYAKQLISDIFKGNEIVKLLDHIDDGGIGRGTYGYDVYLILKLIPDRVDLIIKAIRNVQTTDHKRSWAAVCLIEEFQYYDLQRAINFAQSMVDNFPKSEHAENFVLIRDALITDGFVEFTGY